MFGQEASERALKTANYRRVGMRLFPGALTLRRKNRSLQRGEQEMEVDGAKIIMSEL